MHTKEETSPIRVEGIQPWPIKESSLYPRNPLCYYFLGLNAQDTKWKEFFWEWTNRCISWAWCIVETQLDYIKSGSNTGCLGYVKIMMPSQSSLRENGKIDQLQLGSIEKWKMNCYFIGVTNPVIGSDRITFKRCLLLSYCSLLKTLVQYWVPAACSTLPEAEKKSISWMLMFPSTGFIPACLEMARTDGQGRAILPKKGGFHSKTSQLP